MWCASGFRARKRPLIRSTLDGYFGSETAGLKRGKRGSWRSFSIDTLSDMAKRPLHHWTLKIALRPRVNPVNARYAKAR